LKSFWTHIGIDDEDYAPGYMVEASPEWISELAVIIRASIRSIHKSQFLSF
jgi:hypothetical protein